MPGSVETFSLAGDNASLRKEADLRFFRALKKAQSVSSTFQTKGNHFSSGAGSEPPIQESTTNKNKIKKDSPSESCPSIL
jgi:hypothetical protein